MSIRKVHSTDKAPSPGSLPLSQGVSYGQLLYLSGQVGVRSNGTKVAADDFDGQVRQTFANIRAILDSAGSSMDNVLKVNIFITDFANFEKFNKIYKTIFTSSYPARTCVQAGLAPGLLVEVETVAIIPPPPVEAPKPRL